MRTRHRLLTAAFTGTLLLGAGLVAAAPASANSGTVSGSGVNNTYYIGATQRINSQGQNEVRVQLTSITGGASIALSLEYNGTTYWSKTDPSINTWYTTTYKGGSVVWPNGPFYTAWKMTDQCGGSGCGTLTWKGNLQWNLPY